MRHPSELAALAIKNNSIEMLRECFAILDDYANSDNYFLNDSRNIIVGIAIIYDASKRLDLSSDQFLIEGVEIAQTDEVKKQLKSFVNRQEVDKEVKRVSGYTFEAHPEPKYTFSFS